MNRSSKLGLRLALAFILSTAAMAAVCIVALVTLVDVSDRTRRVVSQEVELLRDAAAFDAMLYQKGFVADYMLTRDPLWLRKLESSRTEFSRWIAQPLQPLSANERALLRRIAAENSAYDQARREAVALFDSQHTAEAIALIPKYHVHMDKLVELSQQFGRVARTETEAALVGAERSIRWLAWLLVATSLVSALSSLTVGFLWARRIAHPMYQLQLIIESAAERTKIRVSNTTTDANQLTEHVAALVQKVEEADAQLAEQRRKLMQSEKLSAIGELAAKLAHEILNPLAGIKAAVQLMGIQADAGELAPETLRPVTSALQKEATRIEHLIRRLIDYARPLAPETQVYAVHRLLETAKQSVQNQLGVHAHRCGFHVEQQAGIPPLEVDPLLMTQVLVNLFRNAVEAMPEGGCVTTRVFVAEMRGRSEVQIEVQDEGPGMTDDQLAWVFTPFRSTKPHGHGLGLATSRNIVIEHGGTLDVRNRGDRPGAIFWLSIPLVR
ncbi:MAG: hypothetical protein RL701_3812 [Pseudomonadota bacterium]|jgi:signal transduction histidine kinase